MYIQNPNVREAHAPSTIHRIITWLIGLKYGERTREQSNEYANTGSVTQTQMTRTMPEDYTTESTAVMAVAMHQRRISGMMSATEYRYNCVYAPIIPNAWEFFNRLDKRGLLKPKLRPSYVKATQSPSFSGRPLSGRSK